MDHLFGLRISKESYEVKNALKKPIVKKRIKRKFQSAFDDAEEQKMDAEQKINDAKENFEDYDINIILEQRQLIEQIKECYRTSCGNKFVLTFGTPSDNEMIYCCFCGCKIEE